MSRPRSKTIGSRTASGAADDSSTSRSSLRSNKRVTIAGLPSSGDNLLLQQATDSKLLLSLDSDTLSQDSNFSRQVIELLSFLLFSCIIIVVVESIC